MLVPWFHGRHRELAVGIVVGSVLELAGVATKDDFALELAKS